MPETTSPSKADSQMTLASVRSLPEERSKGNWFTHRTQTEKALLVAFGVALFAVVALAVTLFGVVAGYNAAKRPLRNSTVDTLKEEKPKICLTKGCVKAAAEILSLLDPSVDPCHDFYTFSCGTFESSTSVPDDRSAVTQFSLIQDTLHQQLRRLVDTQVNATGDTPSTVLVKQLFKSCMNEDRISEQGTTPLKKVLTGMGGWPVVEGEAWDSSQFTWIEAMYRNRRMGYSTDYLVDFSVTIDIKNSSWRVIDLDQPPLGMPSRKYLLKGIDDPDVKAYNAYQVALAVALGADRDTAERELLDTLLFEIKLAKFSLAPEDRRNISSLYNRMTLGNLSSLVPAIPWLEYINTILPGHIQVTEDEPVIVNVPSYLTKLSDLLKATPKRVVANYLLWRVAAASIGFLSNDVRDLQLKYSRQITGKGTRDPRWKECMGAVSGSLSHAVGALYAKHFFKKSAKAEADRMVSYLRVEFDNILRTVDWMDDRTRARALQKSKAIVAHIGYPEELLVQDNLDELYKNLQISDGDLLENMRNLTTFGTEYSFGELRTKVQKGDWRNQGDTAVVNAYYSPLENAIQFPAGILQGVFFDADRPKYLNFGGIGFVIGHEITHGFDDKGNQFDADGALSSWWEPETHKKFVEKLQCINWQYGNYTVPEIGIKVNGVNTQGENVADNGGIKEAYYAYNQWVSDHKKEPSLPGLVQYTPRQLFWIASAQIWCSKYRPEALKLRVMTGVHSPVRFRVNGPLGNTREFSRDWRCPHGAAMNRKRKCTVW